MMMTRGEGLATRARTAEMYATDTNYLGTMNECSDREGSRWSSPSRPINSPIRSNCLERETVPKEQRKLTLGNYTGLTSV